ncbi:hypothetical protein [Methylobacterium sp. J-001]|nr:hypothetical protein [Methylobacterium sp. J-001]
MGTYIARRLLIALHSTIRRRSTFPKAWTGACHERLAMSAA